MPDPIKPTAADRDPAADWLHDAGMLSWEEAGRVRRGEEEHSLVDLFALHAQQAREQALEEAAKVARGPYRSVSEYHEDSPFYGSDLTPDRSDFGRGKDTGREMAANAIRALKEQPPR